MLKALAGLAGALVVAVSWPGAASAAARPVPGGSGWRIQRTPLPPGGRHARLDGVSCPSARDCVAVGEYSTRNPAALPLAERWNGRTWAVQAAARPAGGSWIELEAISCVTAARCTASGFYQGRSGVQSLLAEQDDNGTWTAQTALPVPPGGRGGILFGVWCVSAADCTAVGTYNIPGNGNRHPLAEHWNGRIWTDQRIPDPGGSGNSYLSSIWCGTANSCLATGYYVSGGSQGIGKPVTERWDGRTWSLLPTPLPAAASNGGTLTGISCQPPSGCTAAGTYFTLSGHAFPLAEHWNGTTWSILPTPTPGADAELNGIWCAAAQQCSAVGFSGNRLGHLRALAETWNGHRWSIQPTARPAADEFLTGIACVSPATCTAVGGIPEHGGAVDLPLAEHR